MVWSVLFSLATWSAFHFGWQVGRWLVFIRTHLTQSLWQEAMVTAIFARAARDCEGSNVFRSLVMACGFLDRRVGETGRG